MTALTAKEKRRLLMNRFTDTHTHLFTEEFDGDRAAAVQRALDAGVGCLCLPCINEGSLLKIDDMCSSYPGICHAMIGLHPTELGNDYEAVLQLMHDRLLSDPKYIAIGEVGLDFYWDDTRKKEQIEVFEAQIGWAHETGLPLAIHSRSAFDELYAVMDAHRSKGLTGVFHCFSGSEEEAQKLLSFEGFCLGIGGVVTYKKSTLPQVLSTVPLERVVLETDSPYLAPVPMRGKRNESSYVPFVAQKLADIYACPVEHVAEVTTANARRLFKKIAQNEN